MTTTRTLHINTERTSIFTAAEVNDLAEFFHRKINSERVAVYDIYENQAAQLPLSYSLTARKTAHKAAIATP